jgi:cytochrome P450
VKNANEQTNALAEFIQACTYTKMVIEESMRLYPPVYFIDRLNKEQDIFEELEIPEGSTLLFSMYEIHRHKDFWEAPEKFAPERFEDPKQHSSYYYPFGAGPRMCIGNNFAMYEMIMTIAELVSRYEISGAKGEIEIQPLITLKPKNAFLEFKSRD